MSKINPDQIALEAEIALLEDLDSQFRGLIVAATDERRANAIMDAHCIIIGAKNTRKGKQAAD